MGSGSYLDAILPDVRRRLAERKTRLPQADLEKMSAPGAGRSFAKALCGPGVSVIAEVKRFSPSKGPLRPDLEVGPLVAAYEAGGAAAVSVLTENDHFGGSLADLRTAAATTGLPLLRKDFIVDPYQVYEARAFGASAVLLIAALLEDRAVRTLSALAAELGLDVLLEVHDEREMARALEGGEVVIGVNNRDLRTFEVSLETSLRLAGLVPAGRLLVSESGIRDRADLETLASAGIDAVLVGESLLTKEAVAEAVSALARPISVATRRAYARPGHEQTVALGRAHQDPRVKICGLTRPQDVVLAAESGAWAVGFVFAPSPRQVTAEAARRLVGTARQTARGGGRVAGPGGPLTVGVFGDSSAQAIADIVDAVGLGAVQLHGAEPDATAVREALAGREPRVLVIQAVPVQAERADATVLREAVAAIGGGADLILFDTKAGSRWGGTGRTFPWEMAREAAGPSPCLVAGGIGPHNIKEALETSGAWGADVSSGVEASPGIKDRELLEALFASLAGVDPAHGPAAAPPAAETEDRPEGTRT